MQNSKLAKNLLKYLFVLVVLTATIIGLFIGKGLYPTSLTSQANTPTQLLVKPNNSQPQIVLGMVESCVAIYLSLPPKCKTLDGEFILVPGTSLYIIVTPESK